MLHPALLMFYIEHTRTQTYPNASGVPFSSDTNLETLLQVGAKRPRESGEDAEWQTAAKAAIKAFVSDLAGLPKQDLSDEQFAQRALALKASLHEQATANPVLQGLLRRATAAPAAA